MPPDNVTPTPAATSTEIGLPTAETTPETTPEITVEATSETAPTETSTPDTLPPEETEAATEIVTAVADETAEVTAIVMPTIIAETTETPEMTPTVVLVPIVGLARYQSRLPDNAGIMINIVDAEGNLIGSTVTDAAGLYTIAVPPEGFIRVSFEAPRHRRVTEVIPSNAVPSEVILAGGDLNQDGCIGLTDISLLTAHFEMPDSQDTDINGDGITEAGDLAILAGNYETDCELAATLTAIPTPESTAEATPEATPESTQIPTEKIPVVTAAPQPTLPQVEPSTEPGTTVTPYPETTSSIGG